MKNSAKYLGLTVAP